MKSIKEILSNTAWFQLGFWVLMATACKNPKSPMEQTAFGASEKVEVVAQEKKDSLNPQEFVYWVENNENGLRADKTIEDIRYTCQYEPLDYKALKELVKTGAINREELIKEKESAKDMQYFLLKIEAPDFHQELLKYNVSGQAEYASRIEYFSFKMQNDIKLIENKDTLPCKMYHFERAYNIVPSATFVLAFPVSEKVKKGELYDKVLSIDDRVFRKGNINLRIKAKDLNNIPNLKLI